MPKFVEERCYLTELDIITNLKNVFGYDCTYFGKMLYLMLSDGVDKAKIPLSRFIKRFQLLKKEDVQATFNSIAFCLYDIDHDEQLNIMNLLHLQMNIPLTSVVGHELLK
jgi:hypothetical protein